jgi:hypothetical protein
MTFEQVLFVAECEAVYNEALSTLLESKKDEHTGTAEPVPTSSAQVAPGKFKFVESRIDELQTAGFNIKVKKGK